MKILKALTIIAGLSLPAAGLRAQIAPGAAAEEAQRVQQARELQKPLFRETAPQLYEGEDRDVGPQYIVLQKERRHWLEVSLDSQFFYTSNVFLTEKNAIDSTFFVNTIQVGFAPTPWDVSNGKLGVRIGYRHQFFNYGLGTSAMPQLNNFDFDVSTVYSQIKYQFHDNWIGTVGLDYNRLLSADQNRREFYAEALPYWGLERRFPIGEKSLVSLAYQGNYHITRVDGPMASVNDRTDQIVALTYSQQVIPKLILQPYLRVQFTYYTDSSSRKDLLYSMGTSLTYFFTNWASIRTFVSYDIRESSDSIVQDYHKLDAGGGLSATFLF